MADILQGGRLKLSSKDFVASGVPAYGAGGVNGRVDVVEFTGPSVVLSSIGARCGKCFYVDGDWTSLANTQVIRPDLSRVDPKFLWYQLNDELSWHRSGTGQPFIKPSDVRARSVQLPDLSEQRRIAAILDHADALRAKRREALACLDELTQSIFVDMFGDFATNSKGWPIVSVADLCDVKGGKRLPKGSDYVSEPTPYRYLRVTDMKGGSVDPGTLNFISEDVQQKIARYVVQAGDVAISIAGSIGIVAVITDELDGVNLTENAAKLVPRAAGRYRPEFLAAALRTRPCQGQIASQTGQVTIGKLALFRIEKIELPLPPIDLQDSFVDRLAELGKLRQWHQSSLAELAALFASLQSRAFRGEL
ncbi:hypothetical protein GS488_12610 [Rhodococcus hoagii]|nr:hypothetical protein [Prescottella equi]